MAVEPLESLGLAPADDSNDTDQPIGERLGGAIGAVIGRKVGSIVGERVIDGMLLGQSEAAGEDGEGDGPEADGDDTEDQGSTDEAAADGPDRIKDLEDLSYRELQSIAKDVDVKANLAREEMTERIAEALDLEE